MALNKTVTVKTALFILAVLSIFLFFFSGSKADPDLWGHLRYGQDIYETRSVPRYDNYSYSSYGAAWTNHEWLSELIFYTVFKALKSPGLVFLKLLIGLGITTLLCKSAAGSARSIFLRLLFLFAPLSVISYGFAIRPQLFTYLLFTILIFCMDRYERTAKLHWLYAFPPMFLLWANLHGGFAAGMGVLFLFVLYRIFKRGDCKPLIIAAVLSAGAVFINPYGVHYFNFIFQALAKQRTNILEWGSVEFSFKFADYFVLAFLAAAGLVFSKIKRSPFECAVLVFAFIFSFLHNRHIVLFAIAAAVYIPKYWDSFLNDRLGKLENRFSPGFFLSMLGVFSIILILCTIPQRKRGMFQVEIPKNEYPMGAIEFMRSNRIAGNMFCWFDWSQMCIREFSGTSKVFFDGRYETVYNDALIQGYYDVLYCRRDYKKYLSRFPETDIMFLHRNNPLASALLEDKEWVLVYVSPLAVIFLKNNPKNSGALKSFAGKMMVNPEVKPPFYLK